MGNAAASGLPYTLGEPVPSYTGRQGWTMYAAATKSDKAPCTIFKFDAKQKAGAAGAQNALKASKMFKHPNIVRCLDGVVSAAGDVLVVTEPVVPLLDWLTATKAAEATSSPESFAEAVTMGLAGLVRAVSFLANDCGVVHGLLSPDAVFVTQGGDWKLSRFDLAGKIDAAFLDRQGMLSRPYACPARVSSDRAALRNMPLHAVDAWSLGVLIHTIYCGEAARVEQLQQTSKIPRGLQQAYQKLLKSVPEQRLNPSRIVRLKHFQTPLVQSMLFLEEIMIKTPQEKHGFFESLTAAIDTFPRHVCKHKVLPALTASLSLGATSGETSMGVAGPVVLVPLLKLGTMLDEDEFEKHIVPVLLTMFEQQDRGIRVALLSRLGALIESIDRRLINEKIFGCICTGFNDTAPAMREMTLKALPTLAPKLDDKVIEGQMKTALVRLLQDPVPAIRTNATVCLGLLAHYFTPKTVAAVCIPGFTRALRDAFPHNRERALHSIKAVVDLFDPTDLATKVMPHVCPSLVDSVSSVRNTAQACVHALAARLAAHSEEMAAQAALKQAEMEKATSIGSGGSGGGSGSSGGVSEGAGGMVGWMASAAAAGVAAGASSLTAKVLGGKEEEGGGGGGGTREARSRSGSARGKNRALSQNQPRARQQRQQQARTKSTNSLKVGSNRATKPQSDDTTEDFFGGWGDEDEDDDAIFGSSNEAASPGGGANESSGVILQPARAVVNKPAAGRRSTRTPLRKQSTSKPKPKPGLPLSLLTEGSPKDLMDDSWGQDSADLDDLLGGFSSPEQSPKAQNPARSVKTKAKTRTKTKSGVSSLKTKRTSKAKTTTSALKIGTSNKPKKSQDNLFEEFGF